MDTDTPLLQVSNLRVAFQGRRGQATGEMIAGMTGAGECPHQAIGQRGIVFNQQNAHCKVDARFGKV